MGAIPEGKPATEQITNERDPYSRLFESALNSGLSVSLSSVNKLKTNIDRLREDYHEWVVRLVDQLKAIPEDALISFTVHGPERKSTLAGSFVTLAKFHTPDQISEDDETDTTTWTFKREGMNFDTGYYPQDEGHAHLLITAPVTNPQPWPNNGGGDVGISRLLGADTHEFPFGDMSEVDIAVRI
jgi:hypothetical protein